MSGRMQDGEELSAAKTQVLDHVGIDADVTSALPPAEKMAVDSSGVDVMVEEHRRGGGARYAYGSRPIDAFSRKNLGSERLVPAAAQKVQQEGGAKAKGVARAGMGRRLFSQSSFWIGCIAGAAIMLVVALLVACSATQLAQRSYERSIANTKQIADTQIEQTALKEAQAQHKHDYVLTYKTVHHDEKSHEVVHEPTYEERTVYCTLCNICQEQIDGATDVHEEESGHGAFTVGVPRKESVLVQDGFTETIVDEEAYDEQVPDRYICSGCAEEKPYAGGDGEEGRS